MGKIFSFLMESVHSYNGLFIGLGLFSAVAFVGTLVAVPLIIVRLPHDYFLTESKKTRKGLWIVFPIVRNVFGVILLLAGIVMLVLPGQGLLTILISLTLIHFPGKRNLEISLLRKRGVAHAVNRLRHYYGRPPLSLPEEVEDVRN